MKGGKENEGFSSDPPKSTYINFYEQLLEVHTKGRKIIT